jgi:hypothetical protein
LVINTLSSLVLASTNFFMQVLNAPTREELDRAHSQGSWLDVGVPSPRNAFRVSRFKMIMWLLFVLSSIPIHLLFNSAIFSTDNRGAEFDYFVFDESLLNGGAVLGPGTSFVSSYPLFFILEELSGAFNWSTEDWTNPIAFNMAREWYFEHVYPNTTRNVHQTVDEIRKGDWHRLDKSDCNSLYNTTHCAGLQAYRNVALILSGSSGWNRSRVWDLPTNESSFWDAYVPKDVNNSFWYADTSNHPLLRCEINFDGGSNRDPISCRNSCSRSMGLDNIIFGSSDMWTYSLFHNDHSVYRTELVPTRPAPDFENSRLSVEYCLVEPFETMCQIGLASTLLWVVSLWYSTHFLLSGSTF